MTASLPGQPITNALTSCALDGIANVAGGKVLASGFKWFISTAWPGADSELGPAPKIFEGRVAQMPVHRYPGGNYPSGNAFEEMPRLGGLHRRRDTRFTKVPAIAVSSRQPTPLIVVTMPANDCLVEIDAIALE